MRGRALPPEARPKSLARRVLCTSGRCRWLSRPMHTHTPSLDRPDCKTCPSTILVSHTINTPRSNSIPSYPPLRDRPLYPWSVHFLLGLGHGLACLSIHPSWICISIHGLSASTHSAYAFHVHQPSATHSPTLIANTCSCS